MTTAKKHPTRPSKARGARPPSSPAERPRRGDRGDAEPTTHGGRREGAGRPVAEEPRDVVVRVRLTADERAWVERLATRYGHTLSEWIRLRVLTDEGAT